MLSGKEKEFISFWEVNRLRRNHFIKYCQYGLPTAAIICIGVFANMRLGWYKRATMIVNTEPSLILVLLAALVIITIFISIFTARHQWEQNEQYYQELLSKKKRE